MTGGPVVELVAVSKRYGDVVAVDSIALEVARGEFFSILGPSGCGKTTTLRLLAGFETPDSGEVRLLGKVVNDARPYQRPLGMVFQSYALFPHLDVFENVAFGLRRRGERAQLAQRVAAALELVRLDPMRFGRRRPAELSGGQRQRVALARTLVLEPPVVLLDEPLGALDLKLRREMQLELKALNQRLGTTFLYVTHDQEEALMLSDRVAVMNQARIAQCGTPEAIYDRPATRFVAGFLGEANFFAGKVVAATAGGACVAIAGTELTIGDPAPPVGSPALIAVRPEWLTLAAGVDGAGVAPGRLRARVVERFFRGESERVVLQPREGDAVAVARPAGSGLRVRPQDEVDVVFDPARCRIVAEDAR